MLNNAYIKNQKKQEIDLTNISFSYLRELFYRSCIFRFDILITKPNYHYSEIMEYCIWHNKFSQNQEIKSIKDFPFHLRDEFDNIFFILEHKIQNKYALILKENLEVKNHDDTI